MTATQLRAWLAERRLTQARAAEMLGLSLSGLQRQIYGSRRVSTQTARIVELIDRADRGPGHRPAVDYEGLKIMPKSQWVISSYHVGQMAHAIYQPIEDSAGLPYRDLHKIARKMNSNGEGQRYVVVRYRPRGESTINP